MTTTPIRWRRTRVHRLLTDLTARVEHLEQLAVPLCQQSMDLDAQLQSAVRQADRDAEARCWGLQEEWAEQIREMDRGLQQQLEEMRALLLSTKFVTAEEFDQHVETWDNFMEQQQNHRRDVDQQQQDNLRQTTETTSRRLESITTAFEHRFTTMGAYVEALRQEQQDHDKVLRSAASEDQVQAEQQNAAWKEGLETKMDVLRGRIEYLMLVDVPKQKGEMNALRGKVSNEIKTVSELLEAKYNELYQRIQQLNVAKNSRDVIVEQSNNDQEHRGDTVRAATESSHQLLQESVAGMKTDRVQLPTMPLLQEKFESDRCNEIVEETKK